MDNQIDIIMGQHAALAAIENLTRVIISLKCTKEFFEKNRFVIEKREINKFNIVWCSEKKEPITNIPNVAWIKLAVTSPKADHKHFLTP